MAGEAVNVDVLDDSVIEIELPDDFVPEGEKAPKVVETPADRQAEDPSLALKQALEESERARIAAEQRADAEARRASGESRRAAALAQEATDARTSAAAVQIQNVTTEIDAAKRDMIAAKAAFKQAHEAGDTDKMADSQEQMALVGGTIRSLESRKVELEQAATRVPAERTPAGGGYDDPVDSYLSSPNFSTRSRSWLRAHPECLPSAVGGSEEKNAAALRGHHLALGQGFRIDSDEYFRVIEETTGIRQPVSAAARTTPAGQQEGKVSENPPRRTPIPSAAPTNEPPAANGNTTNPTKRSFKMTQDMQEVALLSFPIKPGEDEQAHRKRAFGSYAYNLQELQKEGKIGRTTH